jgi:hypothetical protein
MTEAEARLALLQTELSGLQESIRSLDNTTFQIKGWCVTASLAIGGVAVAYHRPALLVVGLGAVLGFYLVNCQFKMTQRAFIDRNLAVDEELRTAGIMGVLKGAGNFDIVGTAIPGFKGSGLGYSERIAVVFPAFVREARTPNTFSIYLFIAGCLLIEMVILL